MENTGFVIYREFQKYVGFLKSEQKALLLDAVMDYAFNDGEVSGLDDMTALVFEVFKDRIQRDRANYSKRGDASRKNGLLGGRPPKSEERAEEVTAVAPSEKVYTRNEERENEAATAPVEAAVMPTETLRGGEEVFENIESFGFLREEERSAKTSPDPYSPEALFAKQQAEDMFNRFWRAYPKKVGRGQAQKAFERLSPSKKLLYAMIEAIEAQKQTESWMKEGGRYIPNPVNWLEGQRWADEAPEPLKSASGERAGAGEHQGSFDTDDTYFAALKRENPDLTDAEIRLLM